MRGCKSGAPWLCQSATCSDNAGEGWGALTSFKFEMGFLCKPLQAPRCCNMWAASTCTQHPAAPAPPKRRIYVWHRQLGLRWGWMAGLGLTWRGPEVGGNVGEVLVCWQGGVDSALVACSEGKWTIEALHVRRFT